MMSYDVRIWATKLHHGKDRSTKKPKTTYRVRWVVAGKEFGENFQTSALAESFRSQLLIAQRTGVAFDDRCGLPEPMARVRNSKSWFDHALDYVDVKWPQASPGHRKGIAEALATVTPALLSSTRGAPPAKVMRAALYGWCFNKAARTAGPPPPSLAAAVEWLKTNTIKLSELNDAERARTALDTIALKMNGKAASAATVARKRAIFSGALKYAVELKRLDNHPLSTLSWTGPMMKEGVDRAVVINPKQATRFLYAVEEDAPELTAFFGGMYYAGLRPEELLHLSEDEYEPPTEPKGWGWLHLTGATVAQGEEWTDDRDSIENRGLKHRAATEGRSVPVAPPYAALLERHLNQFPSAPNGRLFVTRRGPGGRYVPTLGQPLTNNAYTTAFHRARAKALTPAQQRSPLAARPYDLRHACLSTWLNAGVPATQVADWAGNSVKVLLDVYAKCLDGGVSGALRRIDAVLMAA